MAQPPHMDGLRLDDHDVDDEYDDIPYEEEDIDYDMDIDLGPTPSKASAPRPETSESREAALRKELDSVRQINKVIEDVVTSLEKAKGNMDNVNRTVHSASTLLDTWTRILSQTEHNQRLLLNPNWQGATQDLQDIENESFVRQQQAERRAAEDQARREATQRRAEEEERRKAAPPPTVRGSRPRGRVGTASSRLAGQAPSASTSTPGYVGVGGQAGRGRGVPRAGSGIAAQLPLLPTTTPQPETPTQVIRQPTTSLPQQCRNPSKVSAWKFASRRSSKMSKDVQRCLYEYITWLPTHSIGAALTAEALLLDAAEKVHSNVTLQYIYTTEPVMKAQLLQDHARLTQFRRRFSKHVNTRRHATFRDFSTFKGWSMSSILFAWKLSESSAQLIATVISNTDQLIEKRRRWHAELRWRRGETDQRPRNIMMMPRRELVIEEVIRGLIAASESSCTLSTRSSSSPTPATSSDATENKNTS
ncbi:hypothetical protein E4T39_02328 [Aureobasidium subglaciale]|nr:hypothetical protein E4T39_02328 [Aureobasidium subglaciale]